jgi:hypothetical protein
MVFAHIVLHSRPETSIQNQHHSRRSLMVRICNIKTKAFPTTGRRTSKQSIRKGMPNGVKTKPRIAILLLSSNHAPSHTYKCKQFSPTFSTIHASTLIDDPVSTPFRGRTSIFGVDVADTPNNSNWNPGYASMCINGSTCRTSFQDSKLADAAFLMEHKVPSLRNLLYVHNNMSNGIPHRCQVSSTSMSIIQWTKLQRLSGPNDFKSRRRAPPSWCPCIQR